MLTKNSKVERMLQAMAVVLKDENSVLIKKLHKVIRDEYNINPDGYSYNFVAMCENYKSIVKGRSY